MNEQETTADIISEMHRVEVCADGEPCLRDYARRFGAAHKRELDAKDSVIQTLSSELQQLQEKREITINAPVPSVSEVPSVPSNTAKLRTAKNLPMWKPSKEGGAK